MVSYSEYRDVLRRVHIGIQPSRTAADGDTEGGAPTVLLEMQAAGIPIVTTRHADIPTVVPDASRLVEEGDVEGLADALVATSEMDADEWEAETARAREFVEERHDARVLAEELAAVYREAIGLVERGTAAGS